MIYICSELSEQAWRVLLSISEGELADAYVVAMRAAGFRNFRVPPITDYLLGVHLRPQVEIALPSGTMSEVHFTVTVMLRQNQQRLHFFDLLILYDVACVFRIHSRFRLEVCTMECAL